MFLTEEELKDKAGSGKQFWRGSENNRRLGLGGVYRKTPRRDTRGNEAQRLEMGEAEKSLVSAW
jgi:hypothetical protein